MIGLLRRRDVALLWTGGLVSVAGDWALLVVLPYVVYQQTGSTIATAGMTLAELLPGILLASFAGVWVDRWPLRALLVGASLAQAAVVLLLLPFASSGTLAVVYVVAALQSALTAFSVPAETALLPRLVEAEQLVAVGALNALNNRLGRLAGLPVGAAAYAAGGLQLVVLLDVASFLVAGALVAGVRVPALTDTPEEEAAPPRFWAEWRSGLAVSRREPAILVLFLVFGLMTFGGTMLDPLQAPWVRDVLGGGAGLYALLTAVHSVAGIAGSFAVGALSARVPARLLTGVAGLVAGAVLLVRYSVPLVVVAIVLSAVSGVASVASSVGVEALAQQQVPPAYRGRVFGTLQAFVWLLSLLGAALGGLGAAWFGLVPALDLAATLVLVSGVVVLLALPRESAAGAAR